MAKKNETKEEKKHDPRKARWAAFLDAAEAQAKKNGKLEIFNAQKKRGEFDTIPESFQ